MIIFIAIIQNERCQKLVLGMHELSRITTQVHLQTLKGLW